MRFEEAGGEPFTYHWRVGQRDGRRLGRGWRRDIGKRRWRREQVSRSRRRVERCLAVGDRAVALEGKDDRSKPEETDEGERGQNNASPASRPHAAAR